MNYYTVFTQEALQAGRMNLKYIPLGILYLGGLSVPFFMFKGYFSQEPGWDAFALFDNPLLLIVFPLAGLVLSFVWRSFHSAAWKIWALENVQDIHRLYKLAKGEGMIFERDSWMNKLEYRSYDQKYRLEELEKRLDANRQMEIAGTINTAGEQAIPYSTTIPFIQAFAILGFLTAIFVANPGKGSIPIPFYIIPLIMVGFILFRWWPRAYKPAPLRFNNKELMVTDHPPVAWTSITDLRIENRQQGKSRTSYLVVETIGSGTLELNIGELKGSANAIEDTLYQYWALAKKASNQS